MSVSQSICDHEQHDLRPRRPAPISVQSPIAIATGRLQAALRIFDENRAQAKSQIKVAIAVLQGGIGEPTMQEDASGPATCHLAPWQVRNVREFIAASLGEKIRVQDCAIRSGLSTGYFSRAFKASFGTTVLDYIRQCRVERAQHLMLLSQLTLSEIALSCGFADQAHYCRVFRAMVGCSPKAWRRWKLMLAPSNAPEPLDAPQGHGLPASEVSD